MTLHYHSPRGYEFVRKTFNFHLPSSKTIQRWYAASDLRGDPGIQQKTLDRLKTIAETYEKKNHSQILCSLMVDEMSIRSQVFWSQQRLDYVGLADIKNGSNQKSIAKQALVFMLNGINEDFEFPLAYYLVSSLDSMERGDLLKNVVKAATECGVRIVSCTFDGHPCNFGMAESMGAKLNIEAENFQPFFKNPISGENIHILLDVYGRKKL